MKERWTKLKTNAVGLVVWMAAVCGCFIFLLGGAYRNMTTLRERVLWVIIALVLTLIGHELVHSLTASVL